MASLRRNARFSLSRNRSASAFVTAVVLLVSAFAVLPVPPAGAHGNFDQGPTVPNPASWCSEGNFPGDGMLTVEDLRQSFIPSVSTLVAADLCIDVTGGQPVTVEIQRRNADGTFETIDSFSDIPIGAGLQTLHADFTEGPGTFNGAAQLTPGSTYYLTLNRTQIAIRWLTTCGSTLDPCDDQNDVDRYPNGSIFEGTIGAKADFAFRTYAGILPNLNGAVTSIGGSGVACPGQTRTLKARVSNNGVGASASNEATFVLSQDATITSADAAIGTVAVPSLEGGGTSAEVTLADAALPQIAEGRAYIGVIVDANNEVTESLENDNTDSAPIAIFCGHATISALDLASDRAAIPAGSYRFPLTAFEPEDVGFATTGTESAPVYPFSVASTPVYPFPVYPFPVYPFPVYPFFQGVSDGALANISLAELPITGGWAPRVKSTIYEFTPFQNVTFKQYLDLKPCSSNPQPCNPNPVVTLGDIDFGHSPMRKAPWAAIATAGAALRDISLTGPGGKDWCQYMDCAAYGINPNTTSLLGVALAGATPSFDWSSTPFAAMALDKTPLYATELKFYAIQQTPLSILPLTAINNPSNFVSCSDCQTLGEAANAGQIKAGVYFRDLIAALKDKNATLGDTTLGDYLLGLLPDRNAWPTAALPLDRAGLYAESATGQRATMSLTLTAGTGPDDAPVVDPKITVAPPPGFLVVGGTSKVVYPAGSSQRAVADPVAGSGGPTWSLSEIVQPGTALTLQYQMVSGLDLQIAGSTISASAIDQFGAVTAGPVTNSAPIEVVDTETIGGQANDDPATAPLLERGVRRLGHISDAADVDLYRIPVPKGSDCGIGASDERSAGVGCRLRITLDLTSHVPATDLDMVLYGPNVDPATQAAPVYPFPVYPFTVQENQTTSATEPAQPETLQDAPVYPFPVHTFSSVRGSSEEFVEATVASGQSGYFTLAVYGYNGATAPHSYVLGTSTTLPPSLGPCPARTFPFVGVPGTAPPVPGNISTLVLFNKQRIGAQFGPTAAGTLESNLATFAGHPAVNGVVYPIESNSAVAAAYADWDASPCDVALANETVSSIAALVNSLTANKPNFKYVVIVGSDEILPYARVIDNTPQANERDYATSIQQITGANNNALLGALANGYFLTDDALSTDEPFDSAGHPLFVPKWSVGRLVETPQQITNQLTAFINSGGVTDAPPDQTAFLAGYDFASDGTEAAAAPLRARLGNSKVATLNCNTWTRQDLIDNIVGPAPVTPSACLAPVPAPAPPPDIVEINGHAHHFGLLPAIGNLNHDESDLLKPVDLPLIPGRVVFGVGCHFGLSVADELAPSGAEGAGDWAQKLAGERAAVVLANTGFGYGDTVAVALSERLTAKFSEGLDGVKTAGEALVAAKQDYWLNHMGIYGAYDEKALQEAVLYGPPMFKVPAAVGESLSASAAADPIEPLVDDPAGTGLKIRDFDSGTIAFTDQVVPGRGTIVSVGGNVLVVNRHPIVPQTEFDATNTDPANPDHSSIGLFMTASTSTVRHDFDPVIARAEFDSSHAEPQSTGAFPTAPGVVNSLGAQQRLILWPGRFSPPEDFSGKIVTGDMQLRSRVIGKLYYSTETGPRPRILEVDAAFVDVEQTKLSFVVRTSGEGTAVKRVGVLVESVFGDLHETSTNRWSGTFTVPAGISLANVLVQAVSSRGIGYWANKGVPLEPTTGGDNGLVITTDCTNVANGWCRTDTLATIAVEDGSPVPIEFSLDGRAFEPYNPLTKVAVSGTGVHTLLARGYDSARKATLRSSQVIAIDKEGPVVTVSSPQTDATFALNSTVTPQVDCIDAGAGVTSCPEPPVDTSTPGEQHYIVVATDGANNQTTKDVRYFVTPDTGAPTIDITSPQGGATYRQGASVTASYSCADTGGSGLASCSAKVDGTTPVANGGALPTAVVGDHIFTVTATDGAGNTTTESRTYHVQGLTFDGFYAPVANPPAINTWTAGNTVPFKWRIFDQDGNEITSTPGFSFIWKVIDCSTLAETGATNNATSNPSFRYDNGSKFFVFNAQSSKGWANSCRKFVVTLPDGTTRFAYVKFMK